MNKKQFWTLEVTLVVIVFLLCFELFSNGQLLKRISFSTEAVNSTEQIETEKEVEVATCSTTEEADKNEEIPVVEDDVTEDDDEKIFSRFPGATSLAEVAGQIKPLNGDTYKQRQNNFEGIDIFVQEEVVISSLSDCFRQKTVDINIYDDKSIITILNEEREETETQLFMPYNLYRKDEEIILEGVDLNSRNYYEYHLQNENCYVYGGENVDVPDEEKDFIFLTFRNGTYTLKGSKLTFWNFCSEEITGEIPEPAEPQNVQLCTNNDGYTVTSYGYQGLPYIDKNGNIVNLRITAEIENLNDSNQDISITNIDYTIITSNVQKIIKNTNYEIVYQNEAGDYKLVIINDEGTLKQMIDLNEETVSKIRFEEFGGSSYGEYWLRSLGIVCDVNGYGRIHLYSLYNLKNSILLHKKDTKYLESLIDGEFTASEFEERYQKLIQEIKKFE